MLRLMRACNIRTTIEVKNLFGYLEDIFKETCKSFKKTVYHNIEVTKEGKFYYINIVKGGSDKEFQGHVLDHIYTELNINKEAFLRDQNLQKTVLVPSENFGFYSKRECNSASEKIRSIILPVLTRYFKTSKQRHDISVFLCGLE